MSYDSNSQIAQTISNIFAENELAMKKVAMDRGIRRKKGPKKQDLELAVAVILVDLASCDESFDPSEYQSIVKGLHRVFGTNKSEISCLVNRAKVALGNLRGSGQFATLLKDNLDAKEKGLIMELIDDLINADGQVDGFEEYFRNRYAKLLGVEVKPMNADK